MTGEIIAGPPNEPSRVLLIGAGWLIILAVAEWTVDQAALHGLLRTVRDLGMPLLSVNRVGPGPQDTYTVD